MPRPPTLTPELLKTFLTLIHTEGDAASAAELLEINQPSMSKRLAYFQHAGALLRRPWLERRGKTWSLTDEGRRVLPGVEDLLRRYEQLLHFVGPAESAGLTFACGRQAAATFVLAAVRRFRRHHRGVRFRLSTLRGAARIEGVANGLLDLALVTHDPGQIEAIARRPLYVEELFDDPLVLVADARASWADEFRTLPDGRVSAKALAGFPLILPEPDAGLREALDTRLRESGLTRPLDVVVEVGGWGLVLAYVREGLGVGLLPRSAVKGESLLVKAPQSALVPPNRVRLICRKKPGSESLDLSELGEEFHQTLRVEAAAVRAAIEVTR
jgi:DNA-binding transcriptional LysR family regulator